jgi:hypothetical protein
MLDDLGGQEHRHPGIKWPGQHRHHHLVPTFPPFLSDLEGRTQVVWLCTREKGTTGLPHFLTVALSYIRRDLKSAGGVAVSAGNYSTSLPRVQEPVSCCVTRTGPMFGPSRVGLVRSNSRLVEHKDRCWLWQHSIFVSATALHVDSHHHLASGISIRELRPHVRKVLWTLG